MKKWLLLLILLMLASILINAQDSTATAESTELAPETTELSPEATPILIDPLLGIAFEIPIEITLPEGWELVLRDSYLYQDLVEDEDGPFESVPVDVYAGPLSNDVLGWIVVVWGYDSVVTMTDISAEFDEQRIQWLDGSRLLRLVVFDPRCNFGTGLAQDYTVGGLAAYGTTFNVVTCPEAQPDTRGWYAALQVDGVNFAFYAFADPLQAAGSPIDFELQAILDSVVFKVEEIIISQEEFEATRQALQAELTPEVTATPNP